MRRTVDGKEIVARKRREELARMVDEGLVPLVSVEYPLTTEGVRSCCRDLLERRVVGRACVVFPEIASERSEVVDGFSKIYIDETSKL